MDKLYNECDYLSLLNYGRNSLYLDFKARHMNKNVLYFCVQSFMFGLSPPLFCFFFLNIFGSEYIRGLPIFNYLIFIELLNLIFFYVLNDSKHQIVVLLSTNFGRCVIIALLYYKIIIVVVIITKPLSLN